MLNITSQIESATKPAFDEAITITQLAYEERLNQHQGSTEETIASFAYDFVLLVISFITKVVIPTTLIAAYLAIQSGKAAAEFFVTARSYYLTIGVKERIAGLVKPKHIR